MVVVFVIILALSGFEQEVASDHLKDSAGERPDVGRSVVVCSNDDLWRSVLSGLDLRSKMVVSPASISHIANFNHHFFIKFPASLPLKFIKLFLHLFGVLLNLLFFTLFGCLLLFGNVDIHCINVLVLNINFRCISFRFNFRAIQFCLFLLSLSLELFSEILLLLRGQPFKQFRIPYLRIRHG